MAASVAGGVERVQGGYRRLVEVEVDRVEVALSRLCVTVSSAMTVGSF